MNTDPNHLHTDGVMENLIEWVSIIARDAGVTPEQHAEIVGSFTSLLVNHYGEE